MRVVLLLTLICSPALADVQIVTEPAETISRRFEPAHLPTEMPPLHEKEAALTQANFSCAVDLDYSVVEHRTENGRAAVSLKIAGVSMTLRLQTIVWLPNQAPADLVRHEHGHEQIGARLLEQGKGIAEPIAKALEGRVVSGSGVTPDDAEQAATRSVVDAICSAYLKVIGERANRLNAEYDRLTDHGRSKVNVDEAVARAFANDAAPTTREARR
jgi:hypothetical protein